MRDALLDGDFRNAVNLPSSGTRDLGRLRPVIDLGSNREADPADEA